MTKLKLVLLFMVFAMLILSCVPASMGDVTEGLVLYLPFDENVGTVAYDYSGYENHGTISDASWVSGKIGYALSFDGTNDYVTIVDDVSLRPMNNSFTWSFWINPDLSDSQEVIDKSGIGGYMIRVQSTGILTFAWYNGIDWFNIQTEVDVITNDEWQHLSVVLDRNSNKVYLYHSGELKKEGNYSPAITLNGTTNIAIMTSGWFATYSKGIMDEIRFYTRALSASEIAELAGAPEEGDIYDIMWNKLYQADFIGFILAPYLNLVGNLIYGIWLLYIFIPIYNRCKSVVSTLILLIIFGGTGGFIFLLAPGVAWKLISLIALFVLGGLLYKVFR